MNEVSDLPRTVTVIPAKPQRNQQAVKRQLRVAAYCRVSTEEEEQQSSYEAQCTYYTDKIMTNPEWTMAGIFADEGITGTSTKKRDDFNRMIRKCRQKKIDLILTKSMSRFARNTLDSLKYIRALKELGIGIIFEKENINTLEMDTELIITFMSAFAQSESESISANVRWGKRQAMKEGKTSVNFKKLYGYFLDSEGNPRVDSDKAEVIRGIFNRYLQGASLRMIRQELEDEESDDHDGDGDRASRLQRLRHPLPFLCTIVEGDDGYHSGLESEDRHEDERLELEVYAKHRYRRRREGDEDRVEGADHHGADAVHDDRRDADLVDLLDDPSRWPER